MDENFQRAHHGQQLKHQMTVKHYLPHTVYFAFHGKQQEASQHHLSMKQLSMHHLLPPRLGNLELQQNCVQELEISNSIQKRSPFSQRRTLQFDLCIHVWLCAFVLHLHIRKTVMVITIRKGQVIGKKKVTIFMKKIGNRSSLSVCLTKNLFWSIHFQWQSRQSFPHMKCISVYKTRTWAQMLTTQAKLNPPGCQTLCVCVQTAKADFHTSTILYMFVCACVQD